MRLVNTRRGAPDDRAAIGTYLIQSGPATRMFHAFAASHPRVHSRPYFSLEEGFAHVVEKVTRWGIRRRITRQDVNAFIVEIDPGSIDDHAVGFEIGYTIIDEANLSPNRLAVILEAEDLQYVVGPCAGRDRGG